MTTEQQASIKSREARLAAKTTPCPCLADIIKLKDDSLACGMCWRQKKHDVHCEVCEDGTDVVPLVEEWRRECEICRFRDSPFNLCHLCGGLGYVPALGMAKVEEFMLRSGNIVTTLYQDEAIYEVLWLLRDPPDTIHDMFAKSDDLYVAKLTVCLAGIEAKA